VIITGFEAFIPLQFDNEWSQKLLVELWGESEGVLSTSTLEKHTPDVWEQYLAHVSALLLKVLSSGLGVGRVMEQVVDGSLVPKLMHIASLPLHIMGYGVVDDENLEDTRARIWERLEGSKKTWESQELSRQLAEEEAKKKN